MNGQAGAGAQHGGRIEPDHRLQAMPLRPQDHRHDRAEHDQLDEPLEEIRGRLLAEDAA